MGCLVAPGQQSLCHLLPSYVAAQPIAIVICKNLRNLHRRWHPGYSLELKSMALRTSLTDRSTDKP